MLKSNVAIGLALEIWIMNVAILDTLVWIDTQVHMVCGGFLCLFCFFNG